MGFLEAGNFGQLCDYQLLKKSLQHGICSFDAPYKIGGVWKFIGDCLYSEVTMKFKPGLIYYRSRNLEDTVLQNCITILHHLTVLMLKFSPINISIKDNLVFPRD